MQSMDYTSMRFAVTHISGNISLSNGRFIGDICFMKDVILIVVKKLNVEPLKRDIHLARSESVEQLRLWQRHFRLAQLLPVSCQGSITNENRNANSGSNISRHTRIVSFPIVQPHPFPFPKRLGTSRARQRKVRQARARGWRMGAVTADR